MNIRKMILLLLIASIFSCKNTSEKTENKSNEKIEVAKSSEKKISEEEKLHKKRFDSIQKTRFFKAKGMKMHNIDPKFTKKDLFGFYGKEHFKDTVIYSFDGMDVMGTKITFENPEDNFTIEWNKDEELESTPRTVRISNKNARWKTTSGIGMGSTIEEVETANGKSFSIYGFEINNYISGMSKSWENGSLDNISLGFVPSNNIDPKVYDQLKGKNRILSNDPLLKEAGLVVDFIAVHFQECNEGIYGTEFCIAQLDFLPPEPKEKLWKNTQATEVYFVQNSTLYDYGSHIIQVSPQDEYNELMKFTVYNRTTQKHYDLGYEDFGYYFEGLINNLVIIDSGTGSSREFLLYDINTGKLIHQGGYYSDIKLEGDEIIYEDFVKLTEDKKPECPQEILDLKYYGYVEKYIYNTKTKVYNATEIYRCKYME